MKSHHPPIATLPEPLSDPGASDTDTQPPDTTVHATDNSAPPALPSRSGLNFRIPSRLSPIPESSSVSRKRKTSFVHLSRVAKARRTSLQLSAVGPSRPTRSASETTRQAQSSISSPNLPVVPDLSLLKGKQPVSTIRPTTPMSGKQSQSTLQPRTTSRELDRETIVLDSSDDEDVKPSQALAVPRSPEVIDISDDDEPTLASPPRATLASASYIVPKPALATTRPNSISGALIASNSLSSPAIDSLPPLPPSSDAELSTNDAPGSFSKAPPPKNKSLLSMSAHPALQHANESSGSDSVSSADLVESNVVPARADEPSFVLSSDESSRDASPVPGDRSRIDRGRQASQTSPRRRAPTKTSPSRDPLSRSGAGTEAELEKIVANVSLDDSSSKLLADQTIAQTAAAVENIALDDRSGHQPESTSSDSASASSVQDRQFWCSVEDCESRFDSRGQLRQHITRDHGVRLSQGSKKSKGKGKEASVPSAVPRAPSSRLSGSRTGSLNNSSQGSDRYVERKNTIGFEAFRQGLAARASTPTSATDGGDEDESEDEDEDEPGDQDQPEDVDEDQTGDQDRNGDVMHEDLHESSSSPPPVPAPPQAPIIRAPHVNVRPPVPKNPPPLASPSKKLALQKNQISIPGEPIESWRVDTVNSMPESYRRGANMRYVFEAFADEAMRLNEPCSPAIKVENKFDDQPCPPWEFVYCNRVLYGENVPRPKQESLEGCGCLGPCDPDDQNCACVRKQERYFAENETLSDYTGFAFNKDGTIRYHSGAVFGCNSQCTCDIECQNKVWQQGRKHSVIIRKTAAKGWGVFAKEPIPAGSYLGVYTGELLTEGIADKRARVYDRFGRTYILNIDFQHTPPNNGLPSYAVDAFHVGNFTRFLNHSCRPNLCLSALYVEEPDIRKPWLALFASQHINAGEELTFSYTGMDADDPEDRALVERKRDEATQNMGKKQKKGKVFEECLCGADGCFGIIFK